MRAWALHESVEDGRDERRGRANDAPRELIAFRDKTRWQRGEDECQDATSDVFDALAEKVWIVHVEVLSVAQLQDESPGDHPMAVAVAAIAKRPRRLAHGQGTRAEAGEQTREGAAGDMREKLARHPARRIRSLLP